MVLARLPDMNPIKNLWSILEAIVYANGKQYYNFNELTTAILLEWEGIKLETLRNLAISMPKRCIEVFELRGNKTHYWIKSAFLSYLILIIVWMKVAYLLTASSFRHVCGRHPTTSYKPNRLHIHPIKHTYRYIMFK